MKVLVRTGMLDGLMRVLTLVVAALGATVITSPPIVDTGGSVDEIFTAAVSAMGPAGSAGVIAPATSALSILDEIPPTTENPPTEYRREEGFGKAWLDVDGNYCDTRNDVLGLQLTDVQYVPVDQAPSRCRRGTVYSGILDDPYTGQSIEFTRENPTAVQIDHLVPLSWAWQNGAWTWPQEQRIAFANDPENLLAVDGNANQSKGNKGPSQWLPANEDFRCDYAERFTDVVLSYDLSLPDDDRAALTSLLTDCASGSAPNFDPHRGEQGNDKGLDHKAGTTGGDWDAPTADESDEEFIYESIGWLVLPIVAIWLVLCQLSKRKKRVNKSQRKPRR